MGPPLPANKAETLPCSTYVAGPPVSAAIKKAKAAKVASAAIVIERFIIIPPVRFRLYQLKASLGLLLRKGREQLLELLLIRGHRLGRSRELEEDVAGRIRQDCAQKPIARFHGLGLRHRS